MTTSQTILKNLKDKGERITAIRKALLELLSTTQHPLSVQEILVHLKKKRYEANKTTIYRQLELLQYHNIVREVRFTDRTVRFELTSENDHHHHLVCISCKKTEDISFEEDLDRQEAVIQKQKGFKVLQHSLEFFGLCEQCQKKRSQK